MLTTSKLFAVLEARRADLGISQAEVGRRAFGRSDSSLLQNIKRGSAPTWDNLNALCSALGLTVRIDTRESIYSGLAEEAETSDLKSKNALRGQFLPIPWHSEMGLKGSAPIAFDGSWLASEGLVPDNMKAVVPTASDLPFTDPKGMIAILDVNASRQKFAGLWCFKEGTKIGISRAAFHDDLIFLASCAPDGPVKLLNPPNPGTFRILGKVVWMGMIPKQPSKEL